LNRADGKLWYYWSMASSFWHWNPTLIWQSKLWLQVLLVWPVPLAQVLPLPQLIFPSKTWSFGIYLNFHRQKSLYNQYLSHPESKSYEINFIKSCSSKSFQQHQRHIQLLRNFQLQFKKFQWRNHSIFKNFYTSSPKAMKPSQWTPPPQEPSKETKNTIWSIPVRWISSVQNRKKTNKQPCFIDVALSFSMQGTGVTKKSGSKKPTAWCVAPPPPSDPGCSHFDSPIHIHVHLSHPICERPTCPISDPARSELQQTQQHETRHEMRLWSCFTDECTQENTWILIIRLCA